MDVTEDCTSLFDKKVVSSHEFTSNGMRLLFRHLESYDDYTQVRPLVEKLSRCVTFHSREYVEVMLNYPSFYPFVVCLLEDTSTGDDSSPVDNDHSSVPPSADFCSRSDRPKIIGYLEVYVMPHLGRSFDCRLERIIVDPEYRNRGVCQNMLRHAITFCTSVLHCNRIDLISDNPVALHIYQKFGFKQVMVNTYRKSV
ncbi:acetyltransferase domain-containing protein [Babesia ovis]|uniref:Acetyltransferase domain-containing protein n=1 Tax=Babesia ovis TaxID=5869 RepID=A0A9W5TAJ6_BABOV|nr:acetyltransferase domain-containing protein [Babesia ovis]